MPNEPEDKEARRDIPPQEAERGRHAHKPSEIPRKGWKDILIRTKNEINNDNIMVIAAGVAFFFLLGLVPGMAALISIYGLVANPAQIQQQFAAISGMMPESAAELITEQMTRIAADDQAAGLGAVIGFLIALWGGSTAIKMLMNALNIAYKEQEKRNYVKLTGTALLLTLGAAVAGCLAIGLIVALPAILSAIGLGANAGLVANLIRWPLLALLAILGLSIIYRFGPSRSKPQWRWVSAGAVVATLLWLVGSALFTVYVTNFGSYNETYGSLGAVVVLLLWLYVSAFIVLLGAELNSETEHQTARDSTEEPHQPMGKRGAQVADELGEAHT
jgi:membrane protein